ncbi:hypothetical protein [Skermanella pratensis]|uniref:hypothetical protein n=1 Tax=Skermanella pratensis TaxID=2233999 RepID=UPI001300E94D|nr:hypothetical protein [Skermanella pratensis]
MSIDLVVFGENWGWPSSGTYHLVRHLGAGRKVVWVNSPTLGCCPTCPRLKTAPPGDGYRPDRILVPLTLPFPTDQAARAANQQLLGHQIRTAMSALDVRRPILLTSRRRRSTRSASWTNMPWSITATPTSDGTAESRTARWSSWKANSRGGPI